MLSIYVEGFEIFLIPTQCSSETALGQFFTPKAEGWESSDHRRAGSTSLEVLQPIGPE